ncbi:circadian clock-controlled protein daywake-like [Epargyreus clarus]|uniref:circadian clock-controlled protein daywake-like n=1 Tax=Epargyreus clarus TaxID=520877 RepID=UPI003C2B2266
MCMYIFPFIDGFEVPCMDTSPQCLKESIQAVLPVFTRGIPSLGISTLDPFHVDRVDLEMPGGLNIEFKEGQSKGLSRCVIDSASTNEDKYNVILHCNFTIKGRYRSHGRMLMFPVDGQGDATIICKNIQIECSFKLDRIDQNGQKHFQVKEYDVKHSYEGQVFYKITNLFKGNPEISNMVLDFMNRNWRTVAEEFGDPIVNFGIEKIFFNIRKFIDTVPIDQIIKKM